MADLRNRTATFPATNIYVTNAIDSDVTTAIVFNDVNIETLVSFNTTELIDASYVQLYTNNPHCFFSNQIDIYMSENVNGSSKTEDCVYLYFLFYDVAFVRCTFICQCPTSGCQYTIIKYKAPVSIQTREIEIY